MSEPAVQRRRGEKGRRRGQTDPNRVRALQPKDFLLGGNPRDPLNLASITGPSPAQTPSGSPTVGGDQPIAVVIPRSHKDPLNLNDKGKRRRRRSNRPTTSQDLSQSDTDPPVSPSHPLPSPTSPPSSPSKSRTVDVVEGDDGKASNAVLTSPGEKRARPELGVAPPERNRDPIVSPVTGPRPSQRPPHRPPPQRPPPHRSDRKPEEKKGTKDGEKKTAGCERFRYGNYNRYYGTRLPEGGSDPRLELLSPGWVTGKRVLDVGCNIGHVTSLLARDLGPQRALGLDIDPILIGVARKNIRHYLDASRFARVPPYPPSFAREYGPIAAPLPLQTPSALPAAARFPANLAFRADNYVLLMDADLERASLSLPASSSEEGGLKVEPEWDLILALSVSKWVHLNWGDAGLKDTMAANYANISLLPAQFSEFLLKDVGFASVATLKEPDSATGFERAVYAYTKAGESGAMETSESSSKPKSKHIVFQDEEGEEPGAKRQKTDSQA